LLRRFDCTFLGACFRKRASRWLNVVEQLNRRIDMGRFVTKLLIALVCSFQSFDVPTARAAEPGTPIELPRVVVTDTAIAPTAKPERLYDEPEAREAIERTPGGVAIIGSEYIEESLGTNLKDALEFTPGVLVRPREAGTSEESQISIRGSGLRNNFHVRGINILLDGFTLNNADGFFRPEVLDLATTKRLEVYKGANALRFGANSLGGAINLVSKTGADLRLFELWSEGGSFNFAKNYFGIGRVWTPFDLYAGFSDTRSDGYREHSDHARQRHFSSFGYSLDGGTTFRLDLNYVHNKQALPGSLTLSEFKSNPRQRNPDAAFADERHDYDYVRTAFTVRTPLTDTQALEWGTQYNYSDLDHPLAFAVIDNVDNNWGTELRYIVTAPLLERGNRFTLGFQYAGTRQIDFNFANAGGGKRGPKSKNQTNKASNVGVYFEEQFDVTRAFTLVGGGRLQYAERSVEDRFLANGDATDSVNFFAFTPRTGFVWKVTPAIQLYGNASRSYEPPLLLELTAPGQIGGDLSELKPQKAWQFELGTRGAFGERLLWDLSVFDIELKDEIRNVNVPPFPGALFTIPRFLNVDRSRHWGTEMGFDLLLLKDIAQPDDSVRFLTAYTFSRFVFVNDPIHGDNDLPGAPRHYFRSEARYRHPSGVWLAPGIESVPKGYFVNSENTVKTPAYTLFNVRAGYEYKPWNMELLFEARNLADKNYVSAVSVDTADNRFFQPGDGRSFYGGLRWKW
jgi:iron complex outermembrane receptor protein